MTVAPVRVVGRYALFGEIASGGMATVHLGRLIGPVGFSRTVAIKRLHGQFAKDPDFVSMLVDEARVAARIQHPNVVPTIDVVATEGELFLVMEYVAGESLARVLRTLKATGERIPPRVVGSIMTNALSGLHAAHEALSERGEPLGIIHRDVSPQNVIVGLDGVTRVLDFGVAKAAGRVQTTREGEVKGKLAYMPVEQIAGEEIDRRVDVYAAAVVTWEALTGRRLFDGPNDAAVMHRVLTEVVVPPSHLVPELPPGVDEVVLRGLARDPGLRYPTALEMAVALEETLGHERPRQVGAFIEHAAREALSRRAELVKEVESRSSDLALVAATAAPGPGTTSPSSPGVASGASGPAQGDSSVSSISLAASRAPDRRTNHVLAIVAAATLGIGAGALALVLALRQGPTSGAASPVASTESAATAPAEPTSTPEKESGAPSAPASASAPPALPAARPATAPASKQPPKPSCKPPYVLVDGIRKLKPECL